MSKAVVTIVTSDSGMPLAFRKPLMIVWFAPVWTPRRLPFRSAMVRIGVPSSSDMQAERVLLEGAADDLERRALQHGRHGGDRRGEADERLAGDDDLLGRRAAGAREQGDLVEAGVLVVAVLGRPELAGELDVLDPGQLDGDRAVARRRRSRHRWTTCRRCRSCRSTRRAGGRRR